ncbi:response regulator [Hymenobacter rubidus]|uniref:hypothetical protein n=1 Tax=Hymenobacter rubidus TaxID=1441626 RepID=UPI00191CD725|nr:hypothetical protein [Hymenobacter rubidus]
MAGLCAGAQNVLNELTVNDGLHPSNAEVVTQDQAAPHEVKGLQTGADDYVNKPFIPKYSG